MTISKQSRFLTLTVLLLGALSLGACETIEGAGQDIEHAGESVQDAAD
jgi:predicted small secreted protein